MRWSWPGRRPPPVDESRWVVVDVESSGLDAARDRLLAVAAVAVRVDWATRRAAVDLGDSFEAVLQQPVPSSRDNILLHGIGAGRQAAGQPMALALAEFETYAGNSPLLAFHASFDRQMLERHARQALGATTPHAWLDIEDLCAVLHPEAQERSLDDWLARFGLVCLARHVAAADVLAECEVLLRLWPAITRECRSFGDVARLAGRRRWLAGAGR